MKRFVRTGLALVCLLTLFAAACLAEGETVYEDVTVQTARVMSDRVNLRDGPGTKYAILAVVNTGDTFRVTRPYGDWYQVELPDGSKGCLHKDYVEITETTERVEKIVEPDLTATCDITSAPTVIKKGASATLRGTLTANVPLLSVEVYVRNEQRMTREISAQASFDHADNITTYDLGALDAKLAFGSLVSGEKSLVVTVTTQNETREVCRRRFTVLGAMEDGASLTGGCSVLATYGNPGVLTDTYAGTIWTPSSASSRITVNIPADADAGSLSVAWKTVPTGFEIVLSDANGGEIARLNRENTPEMLVNYWTFDSSVKKIEITLSDTSSGICEMRVFQQDRVPITQQIWNETPEKLDLLVISTHQDDEWLFFAGTIPYAVDRGKDVGVLYMANCNRMRYAEAMAGLWHGGLTNYPIFLGLEDYYAPSYDAALQKWGEDAVLKALVAQIRKYKPEVIVTHDFNGEYANNQHKVTAWAVSKAVELAMDETYDSESYAAYGAWEVKKLYIHLWGENQIHMDWNVPLAAFDGRTGIEMAAVGFNMHYLIQDDYTIDYGKKYDYTCFGLYHTAVGADVNKNDFFENLD